MKEFLQSVRFQQELKEIKPERKAMMQYTDVLQKQAEDRNLPIIPFKPQEKVLSRRPVNEYEKRAARLVEKADRGRINRYGHRRGE